MGRLKKTSKKEEREEKLETPKKEMDEMTVPDISIFFTKLKKKL